MIGRLAAWISDGALGVVIGTDMALRSAALGILFFAGALQAGVDDAASLFIATSLMFTVVGILRVGLPTGLAIVQSEPKAVLLPASGIVASASLGSEQAVATGFAVVGVTSIMIGLAFWAITLWRLERYARMMPHSVVVGFLAATGVLLVQASALGLAPSSLKTGTVAPFEAMSVALAVGLAVAAWLASRLNPRFGLIGVIAFALIAFYGWMAVTGKTVEDAQAMQLLAKATETDPSLTFMWSAWGDVDWSVVRAAFPHMAAATLVCILALLLTVGGVEAITRKDVPVTRLLHMLGGLNCLAGIAGSGAGYTSLASVTLMSIQKGRTAITATVACLLLALAVVKVEIIISATPKFVTSGLLIFVGFGIIWDWLITQFRRLSLTDWCIAFGIVVITLVLGILAAVGAGLSLATVMFVISYAKLPIIRSVTTLATRKSTVDRDPQQMHHLSKHADRVRVVSVQGFLFFGSVSYLVSNLRQMIDTAPSPTILILDFSKVIGIDGAGLEAFRKLGFALEQHDVEVLVADATPEIVDAFNRAGLGADGSSVKVIQEHTDTVLQQVEDDILAQLGAPSETANARSALAAYIPAADDVEKLIARMERVTCPAGAHLIHAGDKEQDLYLIDSGRLSVLTTMGDGDAMRIRALRPGAFVGEISGYLDQQRNADVVADVDSMVYRIGPRFVQALEAEDPKLAIEWHRMMAATLAERVDRTNRLLGELKM